MCATDASNRARRRRLSIALNRPVETSHARGFAGTPLARPPLDGGCEGVVQCLFGEVEVAEQPDEGGEDAARVGAVQGINPFPDLIADRAISLRDDAVRSASVPTPAGLRWFRDWPMGSWRPPGSRHPDPGPR